MSKKPAAGPAPDFESTEPPELPPPPPAPDPDALEPEGTPVPLPNAMHDPAHPLHHLRNA